MAHKSHPLRSASSSCQVAVTFDARTATWYLACGLPGPAGQVCIELSEGVVLSVDRTDPQRALELSVELPDPDDPTGTPAAEAVELVEALFGTEAAKRSATPAAQAYGRSWELPLDDESRDARFAAWRLALLTEARDDTEGEASLWSAEAAWLAGLVASTMEPIVCAEAPPGAEALRALGGDVRQLPSHVQQRLGPVARALRCVVGSHPLLDRFVPCSSMPPGHWPDPDGLAMLTTSTVGQHHADAVDEPMHTAARPTAAQTYRRTGGGPARWTPLDPSAMSLPPHLLDPNGMVAVWEPGARTLELRAALLPDAAGSPADEFWARAYHYQDGSLLAVQKAQLDGDRLVARLPVPPDVDPASVSVDLTTQPGLAPPPAELRHYREAVRVGRQAADLDRLGRWADAAARWADCAQMWHCKLGDSQRAAMAFVCAARAHAQHADQMSQPDPKAAAKARREARWMRQHAEHLATDWAAAFVHDPGDVPAPFLAEAVPPLAR